MSMVTMCYYNRNVGLLDRMDGDDNGWIESGVKSRYELRCFKVKVSSD